MKFSKLLKLIAAAALICVHSAATTRNSLKKKNKDVIF